MSDINVIVNDEIVNIDIVDEPVLVNVVNSPGVPGAPGQGVPVGGTTGQVLKKLSNTNYDTYWAVDAGGISSIGLTMPSAFAVTNSPLTANGTLAVTATGDTTQYIAGDGSLVAFPITGQAGTLVREVRNNTGATLTKGTVCYINGASGNRPTVAKAIATGDATSAQTFGLIQADIPNNSNGYLVAFGDLDGLDTQAIAEGSQLYLSSTVLGGYTTTKQYAPNHLVYIGVVTRSHPNQGRIEVRIQNGYEMDELHDVAAQTPSNNHGLFYNSTNSLWENKSIATALGYTPTNAATTLTINGVTFDLSANRSWTIAAGITGSGASGQVAYWTGASSQSGSNNLFWDAANSRLGIGTNLPQTTLDVRGSLEVARFGTTGSDNYINIKNTAGDFYIGRYAQASYIWSRTNIPLDFYTNDVIKMRLTSGGNLMLQNGGTFTDSGERLQVTGTMKVTGKITANGSTSSVSGLEVGSLNFQYFAVNNAFIAENTFYNGSAFQRVNTGSASVFYFAGGGFQVGTLPSGSSGTTQANLNQRFFVTNEGKVSISDTISGGGNITQIASSVLQVDSTTKGFLPPRMTTTQKNAITSPAAGLVVYDTTLAKLCVYTTAWETITSV